MLRFFRQNTIAFIALIISVFTLGGATAYAVNTVRSSDIVDGQVMNQDLAANSVGSGKIIDGGVTRNDLAVGSVGSAKVIDNSLSGDDINESALGKVPNAGALNGYPASDFRQYARTQTVTPADCLTQTQTWTACAPVTVTVPAGHTYAITVMSTMDAKFGNVFADVLVCAAYEGPSCITGSADYVSFQANSYTTTSTSATAFMSSGVHTLNTAVKVPFLPLADSATHITTTVVVHDYYAEFVG